MLLAATFGICSGSWVVAQPGEHAARRVHENLKVATLKRDVPVPVGRKDVFGVKLTFKVQWVCLAARVNSLKFKSLETNTLFIVQLLKNDFPFKLKHFRDAAVQRWCVCSEKHLPYLSCYKKKWLSFRSEWCFLTDNTSGVSLSSLTVVLLVAELFLQPKTRQLLSAHAGVGNSFGCGGKRWNPHLSTTLGPSPLSWEVAGRGLSRDLSFWRLVDGNLRFRCLQAAVPKEMSRFLQQERLFSWARGVQDLLGDSHARPNSVLLLLGARHNNNIPLLWSLFCSDKLAGCIRQLLDGCWVKFYREQAEGK